MQLTPDGPLLALSPDDMAEIDAFDRAGSTDRALESEWWWLVTSEPSLHERHAPSGWPSTDPGRLDRGAWHRTPPPHSDVADR